MKHCKRGIYNTQSNIHAVTWQLDVTMKGLELRWQFYRKVYIYGHKERNERNKILKITRQGISLRYTEYKPNTNYC